MKLDKICRACLLEKAGMKSLFGACVPNMLMACASIQIMEGDGLPHQICTQCLQMVNRSYTFKQLCEKSDNTLRQLVTSIAIRNIHLDTNNMIQHCDTLNKQQDSLFAVESSIFNEIFSNPHGQSLVDEFATHSAVESDLAETMQSLQTIAEQCLPPAWDTAQNHVLVNPNDTSSDNACAEFILDPFLKCQFCDEMFRDEWTLGEHTKTHNLHSKYFCNLMFEKDMQEKTFTEMKNTNKDSCLEILNEFKDINDCYSCNLCGQTFLEMKLLKEHTDNVHTDHFVQYNKKYSCSFCNKSYKEKKLLVIHLRSHTGEKPLKCDICAKAFSLPSSLYKHKLSHRTFRKYACNICERTFTQATVLKTHLRTHTGEKPFVCKICGKGCSTNVHLNIHMRTHTGLKPYNCTQCTNSFATRGQLKKHALGHSGVKPYPCWQCGKAFRQKETRDTHLRYHNGERPYSCTQCPKKYIAASHLRVHIKTHTVVRLHSCTVCSKGFSEVRALRTHVHQFHGGLKPYLCTYCGKAFAQPAGCKIHMRHCGQQHLQNNPNVLLLQ